MTRAGKAHPRSAVRRAVVALLWVVAALLLLTLLLRNFVGNVYQVRSPSMRPTIQAGPREPGGPAEHAWVLVSYDRSLPPRLAMVVLSPENGDDDPLVKRVLGLPTESLQLVGGDVVIDGKKLAHEGSALPPLPVFELPPEPLRAWFQTDERTPWTEQGKGWRVDARALDDEGGGAELRLNQDVFDDLFDRDGTRLPGHRPVNDLVLELDVRIDPQGASPEAALTLVLSEEGDRFLARVVPRADGLHLALLRDPEVPAGAQDPRPSPSLLCETTLPAPPGGVLHLRFANVDDRLALSVDGTERLAHGYDANAPHRVPGLASPHRLPRVTLSAAGLALELDRIALRRDAFWIPRGRFAVDTPVVLGPSELFVLGDNSAASTDSRTFGPVTLARLLGRVEAVW